MSKNLFNKKLALLVATLGTGATLSLTTNTAMAVNERGTITNGSSVAAGDRVTVGSYVYAGPGFGINGSGYIYVSPTSIYADSSSSALQNSTKVTEEAITRTHVQMAMDRISSHVEQRMGMGSGESTVSTSLYSKSSTGMAAGDTNRRFGTWADVAYADAKDKSVNMDWDSKLYMLMVGADYKVNDKFLAGFAIDYTTADGKTPFNKGTIKDNSYGIHPYAAYSLNRYFMVDVIAGYARVNKKRDRRDRRGEAEGVATNALITSNPKSDRYYAGIFANGFYFPARGFTIGLRAGYFYAADNQKAFKESNGEDYKKQNTHLNNVNARLRAAYQLNHIVQPFVQVGYEREFSRTDVRLVSVDLNGRIGQPQTRKSKNAYTVGFGANVRANDAWTGGFEFNHHHRGKLRTHVVNLRATYSF